MKRLSVWAAVLLLVLAALLRVLLPRPAAYVRALLLDDPARQSAEAFARGPR